MKITKMTAKNLSRRNNTTLISIATEACCGNTTLMDLLGVNREKPSKRGNKAILVQLILDMHEIDQIIADEVAKAFATCESHCESVIITEETYTIINEIVDAVVTDRQLCPA